MRSSKKTNPPEDIIRRPKRRWWLWPLAPSLLFIVIGAAGFIVYIFIHSHIERGKFGVSDTYAGENLAHSLDLKLAAKATYPSSPLTLTQDMGLVDGLPNHIFQFSVPKDGLREYGLMVSPASAAPTSGYPTIILLHGYLNPDRYKTTTDYLAEAEFYARHGFLVVKPDLRGQGLSTKDGHPDSAYYSMAYNTDVMSLISALRKTSFVDKSNINLWGHSMGAYVALRAAVLSKDIRNVILLSGPVDSIDEMYLSYIPPSDENNPYALASRTSDFAKYGTPPDNPAFWHDASPINFLSNIKGTVQVHVGLSDKVVPPKFSADLKSALDKAHVKNQYYAYPGGNHSLVPQRPDIYARSLRLLNSSSNI